MPADRTPANPSDRNAERAYAVGVLDRSRLFAAAAPEDRQELARCGRLVSIERGRTLAPVDGRPLDLHVIASGVIAVVRRAAPNAPGVQIALIGPGDVAGLLGLYLDPATPPLELRTLTSITAIAIPASDFQRVARRSQELSLSVMRDLARRTEAIASEYAASIRRSVEQRLSALLDRIATLANGDDWQPTASVGRLSQSQLADLLGVTREHVNRTLTTWERSGLIFHSKTGDIVIENRKRLSAIAASAAAPAGPTENEHLLEVDALLDMGLNQEAYGRAMEHAKRWPRERRFLHRAVLATARGGSLEESLARAAAFGLASDYANEEIASLRPRLLRDQAFASKGGADPTLLRSAAEDYEAIFNASGGSYPGVNAAALFAMLGEQERSRRLAAAALAAAEAKLEALDIDDPSYWLRSTVAECRLLLGETTAALQAFKGAAGASDVTTGKKASTRRQLQRLAPFAGVADDFVDMALPQPGVLYFAGPIAPRDTTLAPALLKALRAHVRHAATSEKIGVAVGALAAGADIVIAETLLEAGVALQVSLPLPPREFLKLSVEIAGGDWPDRYADCMKRAQSVDWARGHAPGRAAYLLGAGAAMGKAMMHADEIASRAFGCFILQKGRSPANSLSWEIARRWRAAGSSASELIVDWPPAAATGAATDRSEMAFALLASEAPARWRSLLPEDAGTSLTIDGLAALSFSTPDEAIAAALAAARRPDFAHSRLWLDAGAIPDTAKEAAAVFQMAMMRPQTTPGRVFASEIFARFARANAASPARFEYVGYPALDQKSEPSPIYRMAAGA